MPRLVSITFEGGITYTYLKDAYGSPNTEKICTKDGKFKPIIVFDGKQFHKPTRQLDHAGLKNNSATDALKSILSVKTSTSLDSTIVEFEGFSYQQTGIKSMKTQNSGVLDTNGNPKTKIVVNWAEYQRISVKSDQSSASVVETLESHAFVVEKRKSPASVVETLESPASVVETVSKLETPSSIVETVSKLETPSSIVETVSNLDPPTSAFSKPNSSTPSVSAGTHPLGRKSWVDLSDDESDDEEEKSTK